MRGCHYSGKSRTWKVENKTFFPSYKKASLADARLATCLAAPSDNETSSTVTTQPNFT